MAGFMAHHLLKGCGLLGHVCRLLIVRSLHLLSLCHKGGIRGLVHHVSCFQKEIFSGTVTHTHTLGGVVGWSVGRLVGWLVDGKFV